MVNMNILWNSYEISLAWNQQCHTMEYAMNHNMLMEYVFTECEW